MAALGGFVALTVLAHLSLLERQWSLHTLIGGSLLLIIGAQLVGLGLCAHAYATYFMGERDAWFDRARERLQLEHGLMLGSAVALVGLTLIVVIVIDWIEGGLGSLSQERTAIFAATLLVIGIQIVFTSSCSASSACAATDAQRASRARRGLTLLAVAIGLTLSRSPATVAATNKPRRPAGKPDRQHRRRTSYCQAGETLPRGTSAIRISLGASIGPRRGTSRKRPRPCPRQRRAGLGLDRVGPRGPGRGRCPDTVAGVTICASFALAHETVILDGKRRQPRLRHAKAVDPPGKDVDRIPAAGNAILGVARVVGSAQHGVRSRLVRVGGRACRAAAAGGGRHPHRRLVLTEMR